VSPLAFLLVAAISFAESRVLADKVVAHSTDDATNDAARALSSDKCHFQSVGSRLDPDAKQRYFEREEGICSGKWGFGLTKKGELKVYKGDEEVWDSGEIGIDVCNMNLGGVFVCFKGEPFNPEGDAIFALDCGRKDGSFMEINENSNPVVQKRKDKKAWGIKKDGKAVGSCAKNDDRGELVLIAKYDWEKGVKDLSKSPRKHNGRLDSGATLQNGKLVCKDDDGVNLGRMKELKGATEVKFQVKDVKFRRLLPGKCNSWSGVYSVLIGGGYKAWWVGVYHVCPHDKVDMDEEWYIANGQTEIIFNLGGFGQPRHEHKYIIDGIVTKFESIDFRFKGAEKSSKRLAIRINGGHWQKGGWTDSNLFASFPASDEDVTINDGARADWDPMDCKMGPVSIWSN